MPSLHGFEHRVRGQLATAVRMRPLAPVRTWAEARRRRVLPAVVASLVRESVQPRGGPASDRGGAGGGRVAAPGVGVAGRAGVSVGGAPPAAADPHRYRPGPDARGTSPTAWTSTRVPLPPDVAEQFGLVEPVDGSDPRGDVAAGRADAPGPLAGSDARCLIVRWRGPTASGGREPDGSAHGVRGGRGRRAGPFAAARAERRDAAGTDRSGRRRGL